MRRGANEAAFAVASGPRERGQNGNLVISRGLLARDDLNNELRNWMKPQMKNWKRKLWTPAAFMASVILSLPGFVGLAAAEQRVETQPRQPSQHRRSARPRPPRRSAADHTRCHAPPSSLAHAHRLRQRLPYLLSRRRLGRWTRPQLSRGQGCIAVAPLQKRIGRIEPLSEIGAASRRGPCHRGSFALASEPRAKAGLAVSTRLDANGGCARDEADRDRGRRVRVDRLFVCAHHPVRARP